MIDDSLSCVESFVFRAFVFISYITRVLCLRDISKMSTQMHTDDLKKSRQKDTV